MTRVSSPTGKLTDLETAVLRLAADGLTIEATARELAKSMPAVQDARHRLMGKLGATSLANAVHLAWQAGLLRRERHGDHAGFAAHRYRGEDPWACTRGCPEGERAYRAEQRQRRRQKGTGGPQGAQEAANGARDVRDAPEAAERRIGDFEEEAA